MSATMDLYWGSGSPPARRVQIALAEKNINYNSKILEFSKGQHKSPEILKLNPRGQVPVLVHGSTVVCESLASLLYLEETQPEPPLLPADPAGRARVYQRLMEYANVDDKGRKVALVLRQGGPKTDAEKEQLVKNQEELKAELGRWEGYLTDDFIAGGSFSLADIVLVVGLLQTQRMGCTFAKFPNLQAYIQRLEERPSVKSSTPPHWLTDKPQMDFMKFLDE